MEETILVAIDGSDDATQAANFAVARAEKQGAELRAIHIVDTTKTPEPTRSSAELATIQAEEQGQAQLQQIEAGCRERDIPVETVSCHGIPEEEIAEYAETINADCIILGFKGRKSQSNSRLVGSVTKNVLDEKKRPVLIV